MKHHHAGALTAERRTEREDVERAMFAASRALMDLDEVELRVKQAMRRAPHTQPVLDPVLDRLDDTRRRISLGERILARWWKRGQERRWQDESQADR